jgi:hypothetical protein
MNWLASALSEMTLTDSVEGYLYGRGAQEAVISELGCVTWDAAKTRSDDPKWLRQFGKEGRGEYINGWLVLPLLGSRGQVLGFESRRTDVKKFSRWLMPEAAWNPAFAGLTRSAMDRLWAGGDVWLVEGTFDMFALQWAVPEGDVVLGSVTAMLNRKQVEFLRRFCRGWVHVAYDNDETGKKGTHGWTDDEGKFRWGVLKKLESVGLRCRDVNYSGGKDPGEIWDRSGADGVRAAFTL